MVVVGTTDNGSGDTQVWFMKIDLLNEVNSIENSAALVSVYPNPFSDYTNVKLGPGEIERYSDLKFVITNLSGKKIREISITNFSEFQLYREGISSGLYFYHLTSKSEILVTGKIIIQ